MTPTETFALVRIIRAKCPAQKIDEYTAEAWHDDLEPLRFEDCRQAVSNLIWLQRQRFIAVADLIDEVRRIRNDRIDRVVLCPPPDCPDEAAWLLDARRQVGDGTWDQPSAEQPPSDAVPRFIEGAFHGVDE